MEGTMLMTRTLPVVSAMFTRDRSPFASLASRRGSPTLIPCPASAFGSPLNVTLWPSPATALPLATGRLLYMKPASVQLPMDAHPDHPARPPKTTSPAATHRVGCNGIMAASAQIMDVPENSAYPLYTSYVHVESRAHGATIRALHPECNG